MLTTLGIISGLALAVRLFHRRWELWGAWGVFSLGTFLALWWQGGFAAEMAAALVLFCSMLGFLAPQLWRAVERGAQRPTNWLWALGIIALIYGAMYNKEFGTFVLAMVIFMAGGMYILRGFFPRKKRKGG